MQKKPQSNRKRQRSGFTLVELLVVVSIILILATITLVSVNFSYSRDRVRAAGRQLQSFVAGARDRAIYSKEVRGIRLILDEKNPHTAVAVQYVGAGDRWSEGMLFFDPADLLAETIKIQVNGQNYGQKMYDNGILQVGSQIEIPKDSGNFCTIASLPFNNGWFRLSRGQRSYVGGTSGVPYTLLMPSRPIPGSAPIPLPTGVVIDLDGSKLPVSWYPSWNASYPSTMDILFNPRGSVTGDAAGNGFVHLLLADVGDVLLWQDIPGRKVKPNLASADWNPPVVTANLPTGTPVVRKDQILLSVNGRSGNVSVHHVNPTLNSSGFPIAVDPYSLAETGQVSNQ
jgi:prepilin-type N-terminal cleavage/methylation domain-containing protein